MNQTIGPVYIRDDNEEKGGMKSYSMALYNIIDHEVRNIIQETYTKTEKLLQENRNKLDKVRYIGFCVYIFIEINSIFFFSF